MQSIVFLIILLFFISCSPKEQYDVIINNAMIYDGSGSKPYKGSIAVRGDSIALVNSSINGSAVLEIDAKAMAVTPGFINTLSWATESLIEDGRSQSDIRQGVTLEVFGEGWSWGPLNSDMKKDAATDQGDIKFKVEWTTLGEYLEFLERKGVSCNIASFVGATTIRIHEIGYDNRPPTADELQRMQKLVKQAMEEGALGVGSSLIYTPAFFAETDELIALCKVAAQYGGTYISHLRSEGNTLLEAVDELITIAREAEIAAQIYHLKAAGKDNWHKLDDVIKKVEAAQKEGLQITADMYTYTAGATGLDASMPPWVQEGGHDAWVKRLQDPVHRKRVIAEMQTPSDNWENFFLAAGPDKIILVGFKSEKLKELTGKTLQEIADMRGKSAAETALDLVIEDDSRVSTVYFLMSEENVQKKIKIPWVSFDSDEASLAPEGIFLSSNPHPRAYGNFARLLGKYVRDEKLIPLEEAIRRLTSFPATNFNLKRRGLLKEGYFADIVIFDPDSIKDHATFAEPHQYSTGVHHVFVNGTQVLKDGQHTGAKPGRVVRGPGWIK